MSEVSLWYLFFEDGAEWDLREERSDAGVQLLAPVFAHHLCGGWQLSVVVAS